jgi:hypothetical protein
VALDIRQVGPCRDRTGGGGLRAVPAILRRVGRCRAAGQELPHHVEQVSRTVDVGTGHQGGLPRAFCRQHQLCRNAAAMQRQRHRERTTHGPQMP